jgi:hypothetical protein
LLLLALPLEAHPFVELTSLSASRGQGLNPEELLKTPFIPRPERASALGEKATGEMERKAFFLKTCPGTITEITIPALR